jgi:coenzyme PQQ precursor peptide PqqA
MPATPVVLTDPHAGLDACDSARCDELKIASAPEQFRQGCSIVQMCCSPDRKPAKRASSKQMTWTTPTLVEICIGLEINGYLPAEF